jgi:tRNA A-37 threonylcarbamoyl transferase component Bud32
MEYDRIIAVSNDKTVYHHGNKSIKVYAFEESFVYALEEGVKTSKVKNNTNLNVPQIYSVSKNQNKVESVSEFVEGETLYSMLKQNLKNYKDIIDEFVLLHKEINSYHNVINCNESSDNQPIGQLLCLCHGKYCLENVIKDKNGDLHVIDWGLSFDANKEKDCIITYYLSLYAFGKQIADYYLERYCSVNAIDKNAVKDEKTFALNYLARNFKGSKKAFFTSLLTK